MSASFQASNLGVSKYVNPSFGGVFLFQEF